MFPNLERSEMYRLSEGECKAISSLIPHLVANNQGGIPNDLLHISPPEAKDLNEDRITLSIPALLIKLQKLSSRFLLDFYASQYKRDAARKKEGK